MRYEPIDLGVLHALFQSMDPGLLENWIRADPTSKFARRAWYLFELLTGKTLDAPDVRPTGYVDLLDERLHLTAEPAQVRRQRVNDNLLGDRHFCPLIRRTKTLEQWMAQGLAAEAQALVQSFEPAILARAVNYLFTKETKSSFAIEGEAPSPDRSRRFVAALAHVSAFDATNTEAFVQLQNIIVDPRYAQRGWRITQNYVSETVADYSEHVHFVCPKSEDVPSLMEGWMRMTSRLLKSKVDPVAAAAAAAFGFVFVHPFEDGNGRIHRFLVHYVLQRRGFTPEGLLFPVSAVMLRDLRAYDRVLAGYSSSISPFIDWVLDAGNQMTVRNETAHLYRFFDATPFAEYLYGCVAETIRRDLREELGFLTMFDAAVHKTTDIVDMPDRRASLLVRLILQNKGVLSKTKREEFAELTDEEIEAIEEAVRSCEITPSGTSPAPPRPA
ncbi:MAG: Fic family protein [Acidobacteria bacterium]|nr:Fic family protein [Acidobacteriota bacterium]